MLAQIQPAPQFAEPPIAVDWELAFTRSETCKALAYWDGVRGGRTMPQRSELTPRGMREFLSHVSLIDVGDGQDAATDYMVTLQGSHAADVLGPLSRRRLDEALSTVTARRLRECLDLVRAHARPVRIASRVTASGKLWLDSESLMAPLGDAEDRLACILWILVSWSADSA